MAFGRLERNSGPQPMSDINMTPLIDVMLVLLVIFMITAPLMTTALKLDLPNTDAAAPVESTQPIQLAIDASARVYVGDIVVTREQLVERLKALAGGRPDAEVHLRADEGVPYGRVAQLIGDVQRAGLNRIAFVTEPEAAK